MTKRSRKYFDSKKLEYYERKTNESFYCVMCQAMIEQECICDYLEEQAELWDFHFNETEDY